MENDRREFYRKIHNETVKKATMNRKSNTNNTRIYKNSTKKNKISYKKKIVCILALLISIIVLTKDTNNISGQIVDKVKNIINKGVEIINTNGIIDKLLTRFAIKGTENTGDKVIIDKNLIEKMHIEIENNEKK